MKRILLIVGLLFVVHIGQSQEVKLVKTKVSDEISVMLPQDFMPMTEQDINARYVSYRPPIALYTDPNRLVDFGVNISPTYFKPGDIKILQGFYKNTLITLYDTVNFLNQEIKNIDGIDFAVFEFVSSIAGDESSFSQQAPVNKYTLIYYAIINDKTLLFNFTCPLKLKDNWQDDAEEIMSSVKIKKTL